MKLKDIKRKRPEASEHLVISLRITTEQKKFLEKHDINMSKFFRMCIDNLRFRKGEWKK